MPTQADIIMCIVENMQKKKKKKNLNLNDVIKIAVPDDELTEKQRINKKKKSLKFNYIQRRKQYFVWAQEKIPKIVFY